MNFHLKSYFVSKVKVWRHFDQIFCHKDSGNFVRFNLFFVEFVVVLESSEKSKNAIVKTNISISISSRVSLTVIPDKETPDLVIR